MGLLNDIKNEIKRSGASKGKLLFFKEDSKVRVRFLTDMEDGMKVPFHDSFQESINVPCQEIFGRECKYCEMENLRTRNLYIWSVWDYESKEVKLLMAAVNNCSPIPTLTALYDTYGTLLDRDFIITRKGKQQNTTYAVVPMDKAKFKNSKAKALSEEAILKILDKAYPDDEADESSSKKSKDDDWGDEDEKDYSEMSAKELYDLCMERDIEVQKRKPEKYYIKKLEEWDKEQEEDGDSDDWEDEEEEEDADEWED